MRIFLFGCQSVILAGLGLLLLVYKPLPAQPLDSALPQTRLNTIFPAGGKAGTTVEISFTGTDLDELESIRFSHPGLKGEPVFEEPKKEDPKKAPSKKDEKPAAPAKKTVIKFKVSIAANVPQGIHDVRLVGKWGVSNSRAFHVGNLDEVLEKEPNNDLPEAQKVPLETIVNGIISAPTDVDFYQVDVKKGQRVLGSCLASSIDSKCNPLVEVYDIDGKMITNNKNYDGNDALVDFTAPNDMAVVFRVVQFTYNQGSPEHFYRFAIGTFPWIDSVFPNAIEVGKTASVTFVGRNLPGGAKDPSLKSDGVDLEKATGNITAPNAPVPFTQFNSRISPSLVWFEGFEHRVNAKNGISNSVFVGASESPVIVEKEQNDTATTAQKISYPVTVCGKIDKRADRDWYQISAKKGDKIIFKILGETLGSQADLFVRVLGKDGKSVITELDDRQDAKAAKFYSGSTDPGSYVLDIPDDGDYRFMVGSRQSSNLYGPRHHYQLKLSSPSGKFQLIAMPASNFRPDVISIPKGGATYISLFALRENGLKGDIEVKVEGLPEGCKAQKLVILESQDRASLVIEASEAAKGNSITKITATSTINGKSITQEALPIGIVWPVTANQNVVTISRVDRSVVAEVVGDAPFLIKGNVDKAKIPQGDKGNIKIQVTRKAPEMKNPILVESFDLPANFVNNNKAVSIAANANEGTIPVTVPANLPPGNYNIVIRGQTNIAFSKDPMAKQKAQVNAVAVANPVDLLVLPKSLGEFSATNNGVQVKVGQEGALMLKVKRLHEYKGPYKVETVIPMNLKGFTLEGAEIPANSDTANVKVKVAPDAMPGARNDIVLKFKAMYLGKDEVTQELKVNINIAK